MPKVQLPPDSDPVNVTSDAALVDGKKYALQAQGAATVRFQEFAPGVTPTKNEGDYLELFPGGVLADGDPGSGTIPHTCDTDNPLWAWVDSGLSLGAALAIADAE